MFCGGTSFFDGNSQATETDVIHIFSLASGHLYERLLKIMMLSVVSNTKAPVKFWLLKQFLSPQFRVCCLDALFLGFVRLALTLTYFF
mgnify:FL=1